jgi:hypothetical protein
MRRFRRKRGRGQPCAQGFGDGISHVHALYFRDAADHSRTTNSVTRCIAVAQQKYKIKWMIFVESTLVDY